MPAKLVIDSIEIRNFLSFGDLPTTLQVRDLGPTLILGENGDEGTKSSNGAGKSTLLTAFVWCLFGRTINNPSPGDKVINWDSKNNCYVKIKTVDGWEITRTRKCDGHADLLISKDGQDHTLSTTQNAQQFILDKFGLDFDVFCNSVFCGQLGKSFLEMAPAKRKEMLERVLGINKLNEYADATKNKLNNTEVQISKFRNKSELIGRSITQYKEQIQSTKEKATNYENNRQQHVVQLKNTISTLLKEIDDIPIIDLTSLTAQWDIINKSEGRKQALIREINKIKNEVNTLSLSSNNWTHAIELQRNRKYTPVDVEALQRAHQLADAVVDKKNKLFSKRLQLEAGREKCLRTVKTLTSQIHQWESKTNTVCHACNQSVGHEHVEANLSPLREELLKTNNDINVIEEAINKVVTEHDSLSEERPDLSIKEAQRMVASNIQIDKDIAELTSNITNAAITIRKLQEDVILYETELNSVEAKIEARPTMTIHEAEMIIGHKKMLQTHIDQKKKDLEELVRADNPYDAMIQELESQITQFSDEKGSIDKDIEQLNIVYQHLGYIQKCYSDRKRIKGWLLAELVPYLNDRIHHYLVGFGLDQLNISFSSTLSDETDKWDYDFCSGGERKRIDLAIMFGIYDLCTTIYGQQCNIMVLDEVDGRLDQQGVESFADIITSDFGAATDRPSTIFVISHKSELKDVFPNHIVIKKVDGNSQISIGG